MRFEKFRIRNFKGIEDAELPLSPRGNGVFTLIGLNESGKTTILEALDAWDFVEDKHIALYGSQAEKRDRTSFIPKHKKSNFTGVVEIIGHVVITEEERDHLIKAVETECACKVDINSIPLHFSIRRAHEYKNSDYEGPRGGIGVGLQIKRARAKKFIETNNKDQEWKCFATNLLKMIPEIVYFPTFLFAQPDRIYLYDESELANESSLNRLYRQIFESIAASASPAVTLQEHVVKRALEEEKADKKDQLEATLSDLSGVLSHEVFEGWAKVFGHGVAGREVIVRSGVDTSRAKQIVYLEIFLREGGQTFRLSERSTGFRWFFSFILFTQFSFSSAQESKLFLLDEPASNLHSKAQAQLVESLRRLASEKTEVIFSTHSHHMVCPDWLDQAFIVSNSSIDYEENLASKSINRPRPTSVQIERYRNYVGKNPDKLTYFQPILDSLNVVPSRLDLLVNSVLTEGKSDYLVMQYGLSVLRKSMSDAAIVPTRGAIGMDELIGLFTGWGVPFFLLLDDDREGQTAARNYRQRWHLATDQVKTLRDLNSNLAGKDVRSFLDDQDEILISQYFGIDSRASKSQVQLYFSEILAKREFVNLSDHYVSCIDGLADAIQNYFSVD